MTENKVIAELRKIVDTYGSQKECAAAMNVPQSYLCDILQGKRGVPDKVLRFMKLKVDYKKM